MNKLRLSFITGYSFLLIFNASSQYHIGDTLQIDYSYQKEYEIGGITISGIKYLDKDALLQLSGLNPGDIIMVPGEEIADAIRKLWKQSLFSDIQISVTKIIGNKIFLDIFLQEQPRLSKFTFSGMKKSEVDDIREKLKLTKGRQVTENLLNTIENKTKDYFIDKGFLNATVNIIQEDDTALINNVILYINVEKNSKIKIKNITFEGNNAFCDRNKYVRWLIKSQRPVMSDGRLHRAMKETKQKRWYNIFKGSKFIETNYEKDKLAMITKYNEKGYRDATIIYDTIYPFDAKTINIHIKIDEGKKYYFRNITWVGNTKYSSKYLTESLGFKKGDIYNHSVLEENLFVAPNGVFSLYQDDGYLFSSITPVETLVENDSIDLEMRIYEGKQARINNVTITGNEKTNEHVIRREIRTKPGQMYNRSDIQRTIRELAQLGYFDPEKLNVDFEPDPANGTVDLEYTVEEKSSDQFELSGGWGANMVVGSVGLSFNNFSARNIYKLKAWKPIPSGDGQRVTLRAQSNGLWYQGLNMSFVEPWLGGKKPNSLTFSVYHTIISNGKTRKSGERQFMKISGVALGLGRRLTWPDDFFSLYNELSYQHYNLHEYNWQNMFTFNNGHSNNVSLNTTLARRSSGPGPIYPWIGSDFALSLEVTPPYSSFRETRWWELSDEEKEGLTSAEIQQIEDQDKYRWIEYHKWSFSSMNYTSLASFGKNELRLVLHTRFEFGYIGFYNGALGPSPFEGYHMGGDGLVTYNLYGKETIPLRGYENGSITPYDREDKTKRNGNIYEKFTVELRFPVSLAPNATIYVHTFADAGNAWYSFKDYNAFELKRSAGVGIRIFLPMFGKLGVDWGYGFDNVPGLNQKSGSQFHFIIGQNF